MDLDNKWTLISFVCVLLVIVLDGVEYFKNKKNDAKEPTTITRPVTIEEEKPIKKESESKLKTTPTKTPVPPKPLKKATPTSAKKSVPAPVKKPTPPSPKPKQKSNYDIFFENHVSKSFVSDNDPLDCFNNINEKYFENKLYVDSISYVDFATVPEVDKTIVSRLNGETHYREKEGIFIIINENLKNDKDLLYETIAHEMIHVYIDEKYIENNPSDIEKTFYRDQNFNHKGIFKETESMLIAKGCPIFKNYVHSYDDSYLEKRLAKR